MNNQNEQIYLFVFLKLRPHYFGQCTELFCTNSNPITSNYSSIMMFQRLIIGITLELGFSFSYVCLIPIIIYLLQGICILLKKPYKRPFNNYKMVANLFINIFVLSVYTFYRNYSGASLALPFVIISLLFISVIMNTAAIIYTLYQTQILSLQINWQKCYINDIRPQKIRERCSFSKIANKPQIISQQAKTIKPILIASVYEALHSDRLNTKGKYDEVI